MVLYRVVILIDSISLRNKDKNEQICKIVVRHTDTKQMFYYTRVREYEK